ncbi:MAG: fumarylacetoacetate hydrolase family protein [Pseudomonadota bacterium]
MMFRVVYILGLIVAIVAAGLFIAWGTSDDPKFNPATFEDEPFEQEMADISVAATLAQYKDDDGETVTLFVEGYNDDVVTGVALSDMGGELTPDPFAALASVGLDRPTSPPPGAFPRRTVAMEALLPTGPSGDRHIGIGTNFPEHAEEAGSEDVFNFPKFGTATPARTTVAAHPEGLLDYEVELCMRFGRPIASLDDFDAAVKGVFLCGDFTDRIALLELADPDDLDSGYGFSDAKSGPGFYPTGPFLVIPHDWSSFVAETRMMTLVNEEPRQDARGHEMTLDFRGLTEKVLGDMERRRFFYDGDVYRLSPTGRIETSMTLMSGTSEGVIFTAPRRHDYIEMVFAYAARGGPLSGQSPVDIGIPVFIENEKASGHFLKPHDEVVFQASGLGTIKVAVE